MVLWTVNIGMAALTFLTLSVLTAAAQLTPRHIVDSTNDAACELNNRYLDGVVKEIKENKTHVIVISTLGKGEKPGNLERARLNRAFSMLSTVKGSNSESIITAISQKASDKEGHLDFFVGGELVLRSFAKRGENICFQ
jgi:hypothetical protein